MSRKQRFIFFVSSIISLIGFIILILNFSPYFQINLIKVQMPITIFFFVLFFILIFSIFTFIFRSKIQGLIFSFFSTGYLLLNFFNFRHWLFSVLIVLLFFFCEMLVLEKE